MDPLPHIVPARRYVDRSIARTGAPPSRTPVDPDLEEGRRALIGAVRDIMKAATAGRDVRRALADAAFAVGQHCGGAKGLDRGVAHERLWSIAYRWGVPQREAEQIAAKHLDDAMAGKPVRDDDPKARTGRYRGLRPWTKETRPRSPGRPKGSKNKKSGRAA